MEWMALSAATDPTESPVWTLNMTHWVHSQLEKTEVTVVFVVEKTSVENIRMEAIGLQAACPTIYINIPFFEVRAISLVAAGDANNIWALESKLVDCQPPSTNRIWQQAKSL